MSPDGAISEVGGDVLGYNQFAYCFNNPVNMSDSNGNWPKIVTEVANRVKYALSMTFRIFTLPLKALEASVGVGVGIGGEISGSVGGIDMGASAKNTVTNSITYKDYSFDVVNSTTENLSISLGKSSIGVTNGKSHSLLSDDCTCATHNYLYLQQPLCPANEKVQSSDSFVGVSGALYLGIGVEFSIGFNIDTLKNEMINIYNSEYESIYFW